jgi:uncharacterized protein (DUF924 family)
MPETARWKDVLDYWFGDPAATPDYFEARNRLWFGGAEETDEHIRRHFGADIERAERGELDSWEARPESCLALIVLLDQFSMNIERDTRRCYERSARAIPIAARAIDRGFDRQVHFAQRGFFYLPFEHSERISDQRRALELYRSLRDEAPAELREVAESYLHYAQLHFEVIEKHGRFPGRNEAFGRESTPAELQYLADGGWF